MTLSFVRKKDLNTVGSGNYIFRRYGCESVSYYELDYIESTGAQCIDTGISGGSSCSYEIKIWPKNTSTYGYQAYFCGTGNSTFPKLQQNNSSASTSNANWYAQSKATGSNVTRYLGTNFSSAQIVRYDGTTVYLDNVDKGTLSNTGWGSNNVIVFGESGTNRGSCRVYYLKMYTDGTLVRDFIPVMRVSDLEAGLLDRLTNTFYTNQGTGSFIPGIKVSGYSQLDYLYGTGSVSNINTGVTDGTSAKYDTCIKVATVSRAWARYMGGGDLPPYPVVVSNQGSTGAKSVTVSSYLNSKTTNYVTFTASDRFHNLSVDGGKIYWDNSLSTSSAINNGWSSPAFRMFTTNWIGGGAQSYQVYYKMWTDGELVRYYIPVKRASDNAIGMYDLVGRQFYANDGSTAFTYGVVTLANTGTDANIITYKNEEIITPDKPQIVVSYTNLELNYCTVSYEGTTYTGTGTFKCTPGDTVSVYVRSTRNVGAQGSGTCDSKLYLHKVDGTIELLDSKTATAVASDVSAVINYNYVIPEEYNVEFRKLSSGTSSRIDIYETEF